MKVKEMVELIGRHGADKVTGATGVITQVCFEIGGDVRICIVPRYSPMEGPRSMPKPDAHYWISFRQLAVLDTPRVLDAPTFKR